MKQPHPAKLKVSKLLETKPPWPKNIGQTNNLFKNDIPTLHKFWILNIRNNLNRKQDNSKVSETGCYPYKVLNSL